MIYLSIYCSKSDLHTFTDLSIKFCRSTGFSIAVIIDIILYYFCFSRLFYSMNTIISKRHTVFEEDSLRVFAVTTIFLHSSLL